MTKKTLVFLTGAGVSHASGIKTFRGNDGLWNDHPISEVATLKAYITSKEKVISFFNDISRDLSNKKPNNFHIKLAELEKEYNVIVITQNIDTLHEQAGSSNVIHLHGKYDEVKCMDCKKTFKNKRENYTILLNTDQCEHCHSYNIKHNIILFDEMLDGSIFHLAEDLAYDCDLYIQAGTSADVLPAANLYKRAKPERKRVLMNLESFYIKPKDKFNFRHYFLGRTEITIDYFIERISEMLPVCSRHDFKQGDGVKDKDRYSDKKGINFVI